MKAQYTFSCEHSPGDTVFFIYSNQVVSGVVVSIRLEGVASNKEGESEKKIEYRIRIKENPLPVPIDEKRVFDSKEALIESL